MYLFYSFLLAIGFLLLLPRFILDVVYHGKYAAGFRERLGSLPRFATEERSVIWLHCVSVGETQAARPIVEELLSTYTDFALVVSTTTMTGQTVARELFGDKAAGIFYFPFDWRWTVRRALRRVRPQVVLIMETELWANFLRECRRGGVPVALVNGRVSPKSMRNYRRVRFFMRRVTNDVSLGLMQSAADAERIAELGLPAERLHVTGNVKFDLPATASDAAAALDKRFKFQLSARPLLIFASTHDTEETLLLRALARLNEQHTDLRPRILIAPRHPERFEVVARLLRESGLQWARRSAPPVETEAVCDAVLLDSIGELSTLYPLATIVFVGGSLIPHGGHNILEPAAAGRAIITGAHTSNFAAITRAFLDADALIQLPPAEDSEIVSALSNVFARLLSDDELRMRYGNRAAAVCEANRGATKRTVALLADLLRFPTDKVVVAPFVAADAARNRRAQP